MSKAGDKIAWVITCFDEQSYMEQCIPSIRRNDDGPIIIINDGGSPVGLKDLANKNGARYVDGEHLKSPGIGWLWWRRFFEEGLKEDVDYIVKLDPDSYFHRPLQNPIGHLDFFGTIRDRAKRNPYSVQGGVQGFSRKHAEKIMHSGLLPELIHPPHECCHALSVLGRILYFRIEAREKYGVGSIESVKTQINSEGIRVNGSFSTDASILRINQRLNQRGQEWGEVLSVWGLWGENDLIKSIPETPKNGEYAITHPHGPGDDFSISPHHANRFTTCSSCVNYDSLKGICNVNGKYIYSESKLNAGNCPNGFWKS